MIILYVMMGLAVSFVERKGIKLSSVSFVTIMIFLRIAGAMLVIYLFQALGTYAILLYDGNTWTDCVKKEFMFRSTTCYVNALLNQLQTYNIGLVGLILS